MRVGQSLVFGLILGAGVLVSCSAGGQSATQPGAANVSRLVVTSTVFAEGMTIPVRYTCDGEDISPQLRWGDVPEGTQSIAIWMVDPDARNFEHWVLYNLPPDLAELSENVQKEASLPDGGTQGKNSFGRVGYAGPCPPARHAYVFNVAALDLPPDLAEGMSAKELEKAIGEHILASGQLIGYYQR